MVAFARACLKHRSFRAVLLLSVLYGAASMAWQPARAHSQAPSFKILLPSILRSGHRIYWGALVESTAPTAATFMNGGVFAEFEQQVGKGMSILHWGQPWKMNGTYQPFQTEFFTNTRGHGSIPLLDWGSWALGGGSTQPDFKLSAVAAGSHDAYVRQWATAAKAWGYPFFLRFNWEMNGNWAFPWSAQLNGNSAADYVSAWRHVHTVFAQQGATNVTWVWCPNISGNTTLPLADVYPGDAYVDWTCLDGYNKYDTWLSFESVFSGAGINWLYDSYQEMLDVAPTKPIMIGETASLEAGDGGAMKAQWVRNTLETQLPLHYPQIQAIVWFSWDAQDPDLSTLVVDSSPAALTAFNESIGSGYFAANEFSNLSGSPIKPLP